MAVPLSRRYQNNDPENSAGDSRASQDAQKLFQNMVTPEESSKVLECFIAVRTISSNGREEQCYVTGILSANDLSVLHIRK
jgi:hypothetical protein